VLEAGFGDDAPEIHIPAAFPAVFKSGYDWDILGDPEPGLGGRRMYLPRGRGLGGSSSINAMIYIRGNRADYDEWAAMGNAGWGYDDVLPYFKRAEDNERGEDLYHGVGGPLGVSDSRSMHPLVDTMIEATKQAGHEHNPDLNGARQEGVGRFQLTQRGGWRCSAADAYLHPRGQAPQPRRPDRGALPADPVRGRPRGRRRDRAPREGRGDPRRARGDRLRRDTYHSPILLMMSGIGPAADLEMFQIEVRADLPVGENLQDHAMAQLNYLTDEPSLFMCFNPDTVAQLEKRGPRAADVEHPRGGRVLPHAAGAGRAGHRVPLRAVDVLRRGPDRAGRSRLLLRAGRDQADVARPR